MAKKINAVVKLQLPAGKATPGPPVGSSLGPQGINIAAFVKDFNAKTEKQAGMIIPVIITIYADRSFTFIMKTPPAPVLILKAAGLEKASGVPNKQKVGKITKEMSEPYTNNYGFYLSESSSELIKLLEFYDMKDGEDNGE